MIIDLAAEEDTKQLARDLAGRVKGGMTIALIGELGSGKTTFVRFLCEALGIMDPVSSPSFVLQHLYENSGGLKIEHWDLYRLRGWPDELFEPPAADTLRLIEWADRCSDYKLNTDAALCFAVTSANGRRATISGALLPPDVG